MFIWTFLREYPRYVVAGTIWTVLLAVWCVLTWMLILMGITESLFWSGFREYSLIRDGFGPFEYVSTVLAAIVGVLIGIFSTIGRYMSDGNKLFETPAPFAKAPGSPMPPPLAGNGNILPFGGKPKGK